MRFKLVAKFEPTGDQPQAIEKLVKNLKNNVRNQVLLGVTGSGKTFTMAKVIEKMQKPTLIVSHNKTLAAQLYQEFQEFLLPITIITSPKPISPKLTLIWKKTPRSTKKLID